MYGVTTAFHNAIKSGAAQRSLIRFGGTVFTAEDRMPGLSLEEYYNPEEDLQIGAATDAALSFTLCNDEGLFTDFPWGRCTAALGVLIASGTYAEDGSCYALHGSTAFTGHDATPYLRQDGAACSVQPSFPVRSIVVDEHTVWCYGENAEVFAFLIHNVTWGRLSGVPWGWLSGHSWAELNASGNLTLTVPAGYIPAIMQAKIKRMAAAGLGVTVSGGDVTEYRAGVYERCEFAPLGTFIAEKPAAVQTSTVAVEAAGLMSLFDKTLSELGVSVYGKSITSVLDALCAAVGVSWGGTSGMVNSGLTCALELDTEGVTGREVIAWIAEATGTNARFDRAGVLTFRSWQDHTAYVFDETTYTAITPAEYRTAAVDKVQLKQSESDTGVIVGTGTNAYIIQDNPFLYTEDEAAATTRAQALLTRLSALTGIYPCGAELFADWSFEAGDAITVKRGSDTWALPIYHQTIRFDGLAMATAESTGNETREPLSAVNRESYAQNKAAFEIKKTVKGLELRVSSSEGDISSLELLASSLTTRISDAEGDISTLKQTASSISAEVSGKLDASGGAASTFGWELTASGFVLKSGGSTVFQANSSGVKVNGEITATSGTIGGCSIVNGVLKVGSANITSLDVSVLNGQTINANTITVTNLNAANLTQGTLDTARIADYSLTGSKVGNYTLTDYNYGRGSVGTGAAVSYINSGVAHGYTANDVFSGSSTCSYLKTNYLVGVGTVALRGYFAYWDTITDNQGVSHYVLKRGSAYS